MYLLYNSFRPIDILFGFAHCLIQVLFHVCFHCLLFLYLCIAPRNRLPRQMALYKFFIIIIIIILNALEICDLDLLSAQCETHSLNLARSLLKSECTKMLILPSRQEIHGKQLRNSINITQLRARTNRFAQSPIPYTTLACLIPPSLPSWWLLRCPHLWCGYWISLLFASAYFLLLIYCIIFVFVYMMQFGPWAAMLC